MLLKCNCMLLLLSLYLFESWHRIAKCCIYQTIMPKQALCKTCTVSFKIFKPKPGVIKCAKRMSAVFWLASYSTLMFVLIFMTSSAIVHSQDSFKVSPLPSINIFFMALEVGKSHSKPIHGWAACLNFIFLVSNKSLLSDLQRPIGVNVCLGNLFR